MEISKTKRTREELLKEGFEEPQIEYLLDLQEKLLQGNVKVELLFTTRFDDEELMDWLENHKGEYVVSDVDILQGMIWLEHCPYHINIEYIQRIYV